MTQTNGGGGRTSGRRSRSVTLALVTVVVLAAVAAGGFAAPALADDTEPPDVPAAYYGEVTIDGEPAPEGTVVTAVVDGEERGTIVVDEPGQFGGPTVGDEKLEVPGSADDSGEPVTFLVNGEAVDAEPAIEWESGAHEAVSLAGQDVGERNYEISIDADASTLETQPGDNATVEAIVENTGDAATSTDVEFVIDGGAFDDDVVDKRTVDVAPGESQRLPFAIQLADEGEYDATVNVVDFGSASTTITVDEEADDPPAPPLPPAPPDPGEANIQVTDAELSAEQIDVGGEVTVTATLENLGEASGVDSVSLTIDGESVTSEAVSLDAGEETSLTFTRSFDEAGEYELAVDGTAAGTLTVAADDESGDGTDETTTGSGAGSGDGSGDTTGDDDGSDDDDGIPGFGPVAAVIALLALAAAGVRSSTR